MSVHGNDGLAAEGIPVLWLQHKRIHIVLAVFKICDSGQSAVGTVIGIPCGNRLVVFKLLPAFVDDLIFVQIGSSYRGTCLRRIAGLIAVGAVVGVHLAFRVILAATFESKVYCISPRYHPTKS